MRSITEEQRRFRELRIKVGLQARKHSPAFARGYLARHRGKARNLAGLAPDCERPEWLAGWDAADGELRPAETVSISRPWAIVEATKRPA